jgi:hypothetical protein
MAQSTNNQSTSNLQTYVLVTPAPNEAAFIEQTIRSVVGQTVLPLSILGTLGILAHFRHSPHHVCASLRLSAVDKYSLAFPDKFPGGYIIELDKTEWDGLKSKFSTSTKGGKVKLPSAFPEKGL